MSTLKTPPAFYRRYICPLGAKGDSFSLSSLSGRLSCGAGAPLARVCCLHRKQVVEAVHNTALVREGSPVRLTKCRRVPNVYALTCDITRCFKGVPFSYTLDNPFTGRFLAQLSTPQTLYMILVSIVSTSAIWDVRFDVLCLSFVVLSVIRLVE